MRTEDLIADLSADLQPVRRLSPPHRRAMYWLAAAAALLTALVLLHGPRPDLAERLSHLPVLLEWTGAVLTGALATLAAFHLALPDRSSRWALLPLPAALLWLSGLGLGCVGEIVRAGPQGLQLGTSFPCLAFIVGASLPLGVGLLLMLRHAAPIRPRRVTLLGTLASAALSSAALSLFHPLDSALMVLIWHGGTIIALMTIATALAPLLLEFRARNSSLGR